MPKNVTKSQDIIGFLQSQKKNYSFLPPYTSDNPAPRARIAVTGPRGDLGVVVTGTGVTGVTGVTITVDTVDTVVGYGVGVSVYRAGVGIRVT